MLRPIHEHNPSPLRRLLTLHLVCRPTRKRVLGGVCRGIANHLGLPALLLRLAFMVAAVLATTGIWVYFALWFFIPCESKAPIPVRLQPQLEPQSQPETTVAP